MPVQSRHTVEAHFGYQLFDAPVWIWKLLVLYETKVKPEVVFRAEVGMVSRREREVEVVLRRMVVGVGRVQLAQGDDEREGNSGGRLSRV